MLHHFISASTTVLYANITSFVLHFLICSCFILSKKLMVAMVWPYRYYYFLAHLYVYSLYFLKEKKSLKFWTVVLFDKIMNESLENFCAVLALIAIFLHKVSMNEVLYLYSWYDNILFVYCHIFTVYHDFGWQFYLFLWWGLVVMTFFFPTYYLLNHPSSKTTLQIPWISISNHLKAPFEVLNLNFCKHNNVIL